MSDSDTAIHAREDILSTLAAAAPGNPDWQAICRLFSTRHSCRAFHDEAVPKDRIETLLQLCQLSPSWCNSQPWELIITSGEETEHFRQALLEYVRAHPGLRETDFPFPDPYTGKYRDRQIEAGMLLYKAAGVSREDKSASQRQAMQNFHFFGAPHVAILTTERALGVYGAIDCGIFLGSFMTAAQSLGIATIAQASLAMQAPFIREYFKIPENRMIVCGISFGRADTSSAVNGFRTSRAEAGNAVTWVGDQ